MSFNSFSHTRRACYFGYITQAIVNNFLPLLFVTLNKSFGLSLERLSLLVGLNFGVQLVVDLLSTKFADKIGFRACAVAAHIFCAAGFILLGTLPFIPGFAYGGIAAAAVVNAIGGGLTEVIISPIIEACPGDNKPGAMSLLHSFYCWGQMAVVLVSTVFFTLFGVENWRFMSFIWAVIPTVNAFVFSKVPINQLNENTPSMPVKELLKSKMFLVLLMLMLCAGASELSMSQWASAFAETGLGVSKTMGDLFGPCLFAVLMGSSRVLYSVISEKVNLNIYIILSSALCVVSYLLAALTKSPVLGLAGCCICGMAVGVMWPGSFSTGARALPAGGTAMFALFALAGDFGAGAGPACVGFISGANGNNLKTGLLFATVFPVVMIIGTLLLMRLSKKKEQNT